MVTVFASFMLGEERIIKLFGLGLASAVLIDAVIIRSILVPAIMQLFGKTAWWMPEWLVEDPAEPGRRPARATHADGTEAGRRHRVRVVPAQPSAFTPRSGGECRRSAAPEAAWASLARTQGSEPRGAHISA